MALVFEALYIGSENETDTHCVGSCSCHINGRLELVPKLDSRRFSWDNFNKRQLYDQFLLPAWAQALLFLVPAGTFHVQSLDITAEFQATLHVCLRLHIRHDREQCRTIQRPSLDTRACLHQSRKVRLWDMEARQPDDRWLALLVPSLVLV